VCDKEATTVRENGLGGHDRETEEGTWRFPNPLIFVGAAMPPMNIRGLYLSMT
jgi:hypothetical protein